VCNSNQVGAALQYIDREDGYKECHVIGYYDQNRDDTHYSLIDQYDPTKGVAIKVSRRSCVLQGRVTFSPVLVSLAFLCVL
jgi:hypothetical protein